MSYQISEQKCYYITSRKVIDRCKAALSRQSACVASFHMTHRRKASQLRLLEASMLRRHATRQSFNVCFTDAWSRGLGMDATPDGPSVCALQHKLLAQSTHTVDLARWQVVRSQAKARLPAEVLVRWEAD